MSVIIDVSHDQLLMSWSWLGPGWCSSTGRVRFQHCADGGIILRIGANVMENNLIRVYALSVCFVTILCVAATSGIALYGIAVYISPELGLDRTTYSAYQSNDGFRSSRFFYRPPAIVAEPSSGIIRSTTDYNTDLQPPMSDEEVEELRLRQYAVILKNEKFDAMKSLLRYLIILTVSSLLFAVHWRIAR